MAWKMKKAYCLAAAAAADGSDVGEVQTQTLVKAGKPHNQWYLFCMQMFLNSLVMSAAFLKCHKTSITLHAVLQKLEKSFSSKSE